MPNLYETAARSQIVQKYASTTGQKLTLKQMMEYGQNMTPGKLIKSARHLHRELPVRIAQRIVDFEAQVRPSLTPFFSYRHISLGFAHARMRQQRAPSVARCGWGRGDSSSSQQHAAASSSVAPPVWSYADRPSAGRIRDAALRALGTARCAANAVTVLAA